MNSSKSAEKKRLKYFELEQKRINAKELLEFNERKKQEKAYEKELKERDIVEKQLLKNQEKLERISIRNINRLNKVLDLELKKDSSPYTILKKTETIGVLYFACSIGNGFFGKLVVPEEYSFKGPIIQFINPEFKVNCEHEWTPALLITRFIESVLVSDDIIFPDYDNSDIEKVKLAQEIFPDFFKNVIVD